MKATLIDVMGDDLRVVNSARVSFAKTSEWGPMVDEDDFNLGEKDIKLLSYLAKHGHWTPFSHVMITMHEKVPIFIARQRFKHMVGFTYNEVSRRYVDDEPEFFWPDEWREAPVNMKQGSGGKHVNNDLFMKEYNEFIREAAAWYNRLIVNGVAPEQARMVLPQAMYTEYYVTGSLAAWARAYKQRSDEHAQKEIQDLAKDWGDTISNIPQLKHSWAALTQN